MDKNIEETLSLSPLYVTMTEEEKKILIQKIVLTLNTPPDNEKTASGYIRLDIFQSFFILSEEL